MPILLFPERYCTNGRAALMKFVAAPGRSPQSTFGAVSGQSSSSTSAQLIFINVERPLFLFRQISIVSEWFFWNFYTFYEIFLKILNNFWIFSHKFPQILSIFFRLLSKIIIFRIYFGSYSCLWIFFEWSKQKNDKFFKKVYIL